MPRGHKGEPRTPGAGRKKGSPNKVTTALKEMIIGALDDAGGREYLTKQAKENPASFLTLIGKYIPSELNAKMMGAIKVDGTINFIRPDNKV